jgi:hypothetical protein
MPKQTGEDDMAERDSPEAATEGSLARAEAAAEREAALEAAEATAETDLEAGGGSTSPNVVTPRVRTSSKTKAAPKPKSSSTTHDATPVTRARSAASAGIAPTTAVAVRSEPPRSVSGETISVTQGGVETVTATTVEVRQGGIGRAQATDIAVSQGGIGLARGDRVSVELGGIGAALANEVHVTQSGVGSIVARDVRIEQSAVRMLVANNVQSTKTTGVLFLVARKVEGDVRTLLDWRGAIAFGAAFGILASLLRGRRPR